MKARIIFTVVIALFYTSLCAQSDSVIVNGSTGIRVEGNTRVRNLPQEGNSFRPSDNITPRTYSGTHTLVADDNGMIGVIKGIAITELEDVDFVEHTSVVEVPFDPTNSLASIKVAEIDSIQVRMGPSRANGLAIENESGWVSVPYNCVNCCSRYNWYTGKWERYDCIRRRNERGIVWGESQYERVLEFRIKESNHWAAYLQKRGRASSTVLGSGAVDAEGRLDSEEPYYYRQQFGSNAVNVTTGWTDWIQLEAIAPNPYLDDLYEATITLYNSRKAYRIVAASTKGFPAVPSKGVAAIDPYFHIFIEKLD